MFSIINVEIEGMEDYSYLDKKYFIDNTVYNCPFCNRKNIHYTVIKNFEFNWTKEKRCYGFLTKCSFCEKTSMHLSYECLTSYKSGYMGFESGYYVEKGTDIDAKIFYSCPTSFFAMDKRIPRIIREIVTEAEGSIKMNFLTGASACARKAIYELLEIEKPSGVDYCDKIKNLKKKYSDIDPNYFDILSHIQDMTSDKVHEQSWPKWDSATLKLIIETLKSVLYEIYVLPQIKKERSIAIQKIQQEIKIDKKQEHK